MTLLLQHIALALQAGSDRGSYLRRAGERGGDPGPWRIGVFEPHHLPRRCATLLKIGFVLIGVAVAPDRRIVRRAPAETRQQGRNHQTGAKQFHMAEGKGPTPMRRRQTGYEMSRRL